jgi:anti-sigma regulatory factor (Ser/Thr protein kinase)
MRPRPRIGPAPLETRRRAFACAAESVGAARRFVTEAIEPAGAAPDVPALLVSELATNAVRHARTDFEVRVHVDDHSCRVEVVNDAPEMLAALREPSDEGGRGLQIVEALATRWGAETQGAAKVVWFECDLGNPSRS